MVDTEQNISQELDKAINLQYFFVGLGQAALLAVERYSREMNLKKCKQIKACETDLMLYSKVFSVRKMCPR